MYEFWYDYVKPKHGEKAKLCYMDTEGFIVHMKIDNFYKYILVDTETRFELDRSLPKVKINNSNWFSER